MKDASGEGRTVLVVDDEPDLCEIVRRMLDSRGFTVLTAYGICDALARSEEHVGALALLVTDLRMPDGNGCDLATVVRQLHPETAVLYMSGLPADNDCLLGGNGTFLTKPFTPVELLAAVDDALAIQVGR